MQQLVISVAEKGVSFSEISRLLNDANTSTREHVSQQIEQMKMENAQQKHREEFLTSLHFPEINSRQEGVEEAHKETFQWIFNQSGKKTRPWSNFVEWLTTGSAKYWISGKAGSGKSTLIKYIYKDPRTIEALKAWAGSGELLVPTLFF